MADDESSSDAPKGAALKKLAAKPGGKVLIFVAVGGVLYVGYRYYKGSGTASAVSPAATADPTSASGDSGTTTPDTAQTLSSWYDATESRAVAADPNNASLIDATLNDLQNGNPLTAGESTEWQNILSAFGAPPTPVGSAAGGTVGSAAPAGQASVGVATAGTGLTSNADSPSNSSLVAGLPAVLSGHNVISSSGDGGIGSSYFTQDNPLGPVTQYQTTNSNQPGAGPITLPTSGETTLQMDLANAAAYNLTGPQDVNPAQVIGPLSYSVVGYTNNDPTKPIYG
jgi:hypothetical protein